MDNYVNFHKGTLQLHSLLFKRGMCALAVRPGLSRANGWEVFEGWWRCRTLKSGVCRTRCLNRVACGWAFKRRWEKVSHHTQPWIKKQRRNIDWACPQTSFAIHYCLTVWSLRARHRQLPWRHAATALTFFPRGDVCSCFPLLQAHHHRFEEISTPPQTPRRPLL